MPRKAMSLKRSEKIASQLTDTESFKDFSSFAGEHLKILNRPETSMHGKIGQTVPFRLNPVQEDFHRRIMRAREAGRPGRFLVLKARRMGLSTVTQAFMFHQCLTNRNRNAFITAVDRITTNNIFLMAKKMYDNLPSGGAPTGSGKPARAGSQEEAAAVGSPDVSDLRPELRRNNDNELWMTHPLDETKGLNSKFEVTVADAVHSTRGFEVHYFHGSEIAFWGDPETFMLGLMQTISDDPETLVVLESTANGAGGYFYREFMKAWNGEADSDWEAVFYPWHSMPNYRRALPEGTTHDDLLKRFDKVLLDMIRAYDLAPEQAYWAYKTWLDKCQGDWDLFRQEYPGKVDDAFSFSASRVFAEKDLLPIESISVRRPLFVGHIKDGESRHDQSRLNFAGTMVPELTGDSGGPLWVWEGPVKDEGYVVAVDPSSGKSVGDFTAIQVLKAKDRNQVAEFRGTLSPLPTAECAVLLARHYNDALLTWEVNGVGHAVSLGVMQTEYWNLYQREHIESSSFDARYGWSTTVATKPIMVGVGAEIVSSKIAIIASSRLMSEMRFFMELTKRRTTSVALVSGDENYKRVKIGAPPGEHDDLVMAWLQAQAVCDLEHGLTSRRIRQEPGAPPPRSDAWEEYDPGEPPKGDTIGSGWM